MAELAAVSHLHLHGLAANIGKWKERCRWHVIGKYLVRGLGSSRVNSGLMTELGACGARPRFIARYRHSRAHRSVGMSDDIIVRNVVLVS